MSRATLTRAGATRTSRRLADGREIIYFEDTVGASGRSAPTARTARDTRDLGDRAAAGQLRHDALTGDWVAVASHRSNRTFLPPKDECPLCPTGTGSLPSEVPESSYDVVVFENRFPSYAPLPDHPGSDHPGPDPGPSRARSGGPDLADLLRVRPASGRCEVVCFTSDHDATFADLAPSRVRTVIDAWADRTAHLGRLPEVEQVFCFENRGQLIGVTLHHPHGQIYAYPYLPARSATLLARATEHHARTGRLLGADLLAAELEAGDRIVIDGEHWTAYVPFAARWPVEVHLVPRRDVPDLPALTDDERADLAVVYLDLLGRLDRYYVADDGGPVRLPYIAGWQQAPAKRGRDVSRLHLQVMSVLRSPVKLKYLAGSESGVGGWVNDVPPEQVAARLREVAR